MARVHIREVVFGSDGRYAPGASVLVCEPGTSSPTVAGTPITAPLKSARTGGTTLTNPLTADANGEVNAWLDAYQQVDLYETYLGATRNVPYFSPTVDQADYVKSSGATLSSPTINNPSIAGGSASGMTLTTPTLTTPSITDGSLAGGLTADLVLTQPVTGALFKIRSTNSSATAAAGRDGARSSLVWIRDLDPNLDFGCALAVDMIEDSPSASKGRTGIQTTANTRPDAGESSALLCVQSGAGGSGTFYHANELRPAGVPNRAYSEQSAIEVGSTDMGAAIYAGSGGYFTPAAGNDYTTLTGAVTNSQTTLPVADLAKIPQPGAAGIHGPGAWPSPLYLDIDGEYVSYTNLSASSGPGNVTGVVRGINSTAATHSSGAVVKIRNANHAAYLEVVFPISKGMLIEPYDGLFDTRQAFAIGTHLTGSPADVGRTLVMLMNGNLSTVGTVQAASLVATGAIQATGGQIVFPATQVPSANATTFDDYKEGTWTPSVGGTATYTTQTGTYIKKGREVTVWGILVINAIGTGSPSTISGLPYASDLNASGTVDIWLSLAASYVSLAVVTIGSTLALTGATAATASNAVVNALGSGSTVRFTCTYRTAN